MSGSMYFCHFELRNWVGQCGGRGKWKCGGYGQLWVLAHTKVVIAATPCFIDSEHDSSGSPARGRFFNLKIILPFLLIKQGMPCFPHAQGRGRPPRLLLPRRENASFAFCSFPPSQQAAFSRNPHCAPQKHAFRTLLSPRKDAAETHPYFCS